MAGLRAMEMIERVVGGEDPKEVLSGAGGGKKEGAEDEEGSLKERVERFLREKKEG